MKIKLHKDWRAFGQTNKAGTILDITNKETIAYLTDNGFLYEEKKEKKATQKLLKKIIN